MMKLMKRTAQKILFPVLALLPVLLLASCSDMPTAGLVKLKSESELRQMAEEECPPSTFVRMETGNNKNICYFTDDACGFEFTISSSAYQPSFDGIRGGYIETTQNAWKQCYYDYVWDVTKSRADAIAAQAGFTIEKEENPPIRPYAELHTDRTLYQISDGMIQLGQLIKSEDVHHQYDTCELWAKHYTTDGVYADGLWREFAFYRFKDDVTADFEDHATYSFMDSAEEQLGVKCTFDHKEEMKEGEIPGLSSQENYDTANDNRVTDVYFFTTETGEKKLIANYQVRQKVYYIADAE